MGSGDVVIKSLVELGMDDFEFHFLVLVLGTESETNCDYCGPGTWPGEERAQG